MKVGTDGVLLGAWANVSGRKRVLDIGTGSGVIAIMLGQRTPKAIVEGVEIDEVSAAQAAENMQAAPWANRLKLHQSSIQDFARQAPEPYDLIVSNPPFFTGGTFSDSDNRSNVRHTVKLPHGDLLSAVRDLLTEKGRFALILPFIEGLRFQEMAATYHLYCTHCTEVKPKADKPVERLLLNFERKEPAKIKQDELIIQKEKRNDWTDQYTALTKDFYLNM